MCLTAIKKAKNLGKSIASHTGSQLVIVVLGRHKQMHLHVAMLDAKHYATNGRTFGAGRMSIGQKCLKGIRNATLANESVSHGSRCGLIALAPGSACL